MTTRSLFINVTVIVISIVYCIYSFDNSMDSFEFDVKNLDYSQRNRLFEYLDKNKDYSLSKNELNTLLRQLFYSKKSKKTLVNESNEENIYKALNFTSNDKQLERDEFTELWNDWIKVILKPRSALIIVDVQNDFMNGSLTVPNGTVIIPVINELIHCTPFDVVVYTYDWHPSNHCSFLESAQNEFIDRKIISMSEKSIKDLKNGSTVRYEKYPDVEQKLWPKHCVQKTLGAKLYKNLASAPNKFFIRKGTDPDIDSYSAFQDNKGIHKTLLHKYLQMRGITDVYLSGVLYEYCVGKTAIDALNLGYRTAFVENAIQTADTTAREQMRKTLIGMSANIIQSDEAQDMVSGRERTVEMGIVLAKKLQK